MSENLQRPTPGAARHGQPPVVMLFSSGAKRRDFRFRSFATYLTNQNFIVVHFFLAINGDLAKRIIDLSGAEASIESEERRFRPSGSEVNRLLADNSLAAELLGWTPRVDLEEGLELTIAWQREHMERYRPDAYVV